MKVEELVAMTQDRPQRRNVKRVAAVLILAGLGVVLAMAVLQPRGGEPAKTPRPLPPSAGPLTGAAADLASLVERGRARTYHAVYEVAGDKSRGSVRIEVWRKGDLVRQEETVTAGGRTLVTAGYRLPDRVVICTREGKNEAWTCAPGPKPTDGAGDPVIGSVASQLDGKDVKAKDDEKIAGQRARCYRIREAKTAESSEICLTSQGIPLRLSAGRARLEIVDLETKVDDGVFEPPAGGGSP